MMNVKYFSSLENGIAIFIGKKPKYLKKNVNEKYFYPD
jgi:hypothetical protein